MEGVSWLERIVAAEEARMLDNAKVQARLKVDIQRSKRLHADLKARELLLLEEINLLGESIATRKGERKRLAGEAASAAAATNSASSEASKKRPRIAPLPGEAGQAGEQARQGEEPADSHPDLTAWPDLRSLYLELDPAINRARTLYHKWHGTAGRARRNPSLTTMDWDCTRHNENQRYYERIREEVLKLKERIRGMEKQDETIPKMKEKGKKYNRSLQTWRVVVTSGRAEIVPPSGSSCGAREGEGPGAGQPVVPTQ